MTGFGRDFFDRVIGCGAAEEFYGLVNGYAERIGRALAQAGTEEREQLIAQMTICYTLADGIRCALEESEAEAKVDDARRIHAELFGHDAG